MGLYQRRKTDKKKGNNDKSMKDFDVKLRHDPHNKKYSVVSVICKKNNLRF